jgi:phosphoribosylformylglycinamidine synthase
MWKAHVYVTLKPGVLDPQGATVHRALTANGFESLKSVRVGKFMELTLAVASETRARAQVDEMCRKLLANPVIENYRFELVKAEAEGADTG